jgi:hypothetical protein
MAVIVNTNRPSQLLALLKQQNAKKRIETWVDEDNFFTHKPPQWCRQAWFKRLGIGVADGHVPEDSNRVRGADVLEQYYGAHDTGPLPLGVAPDSVDVLDLLVGAPETLRRAEAERPVPDDLIDRGELDELVRQAQYIELRALAVRLREIRERIGFSLTDVSEQSGLTRAAISRFENTCNLNHTLETLFRYVEALGVRLRLVVDDPTESGKDD